MRIHATMTREAHEWLADSPEQVRKEFFGALALACADEASLLRRSSAVRGRAPGQMLRAFAAGSLIVVFEWHMALSKIRIVEFRPAS